MQNREVKRCTVSLQNDQTAYDLPMKSSRSCLCLTTSDWIVLLWPLGLDVSL